MCWNDQVSIISFGFVSIVCGLLVKRNLPNDLLLAIFILSYGTMQLFEYFMWIGQPCKMSNYIATILAYILLFAHPIAIATGIYFDKKYKKTKYKKYAIYFGLAIFIIGLLLLYISRNDYKFCSYPHEINKHLVWDFPIYYHSIILPACILIALLLVKPLPFLLLMLAYFIVPALFLKFILQTEYTSLGSFWCWIVATFSIIAYFINGRLNYNIIQ